MDNIIRKDNIILKAATMILTFLMFFGLVMPFASGVHAASKRPGNVKNVKLGVRYDTDGYVDNITLDWKKVKGAKSYRIWVKKDSGKWKVEEKAFRFNSLWYSPDKSGTYRFRIKAVGIGKKLSKKYSKVVKAKITTVAFYHAFTDEEVAALPEKVDYPCIVSTYDNQQSPTIHSKEEMLYYLDCIYEGMGETIKTEAELNAFPIKYMKTTGIIDIGIPERACRYKALAEELTKDCNTDKEKMDAIGQWKEENIKYDISTRNDLNEISILDKKAGICETMSKMSALLARYSGVPACVATSRKANHAIMIVCIDGEWHAYECAASYGPFRDYGEVSKLFEGKVKGVNDWRIWPDLFGAV